jgi:hypothetical protein
MVWSKWRLDEVVTYDSKHTSTISRGEIRARFHREQPRRGGKSPKKEWVTICVEADGLTKIYRNMVLQGVKPIKRERLHHLCCQAVAYYGLLETVEGFPEQEFV